MIDLDEITTTYEAPLTSKSDVLEVYDNNLNLDQLGVQMKKYVPNKPEQMWIKGPVDSNDYFTIKNVFSGKLLTGGPNQVLMVKPGVHFNDLTKEFDFTGALPRGVKVSIFWFLA